MGEKIIEGFKIITGVAYRDLKKEWKEQNIEIDHLQFERNEARCKVEKLEKNLKEEKELTKNLKKEIKDLTDKFNTKNSKITKKHKEEVDKLKKQIEDFSYGLANKDIEIEKLKADKNTLMEELAINDQELIEANTKLTIMENKLQEQDTLIRDLKTYLEQANSTDNVQPDCEEPCCNPESEDIPETPWGEGHNEQLAFNFENDEMVVSDIEVIPGEIHINTENLNITYTPMGNGEIASFTINDKDDNLLSELKPEPVVELCENPEPKKTKKATTKKTTTKKTTGKKTTKKSKEA